MDEPTKKRLWAYRMAIDAAFKAAVESVKPNSHDEQAVIATAFADMLGGIIGTITGTGQLIAEDDPSLPDPNERDASVQAGREEVTRELMKRVLEVAAKAETMAMEVIRERELAEKVGRRGKP